MVWDASISSVDHCDEIPSVDQITTDYVDNKLKIGITNCQKSVEEEVSPRCNEGSVFQIQRDVDTANEVNIDHSTDRNETKIFPIVTLDKIEHVSVIQDNTTMAQAACKIRKKNLKKKIVLKQKHSKLGPISSRTRAASGKKFSAPPAPKIKIMDESSFHSSDHVVSNDSDSNFKQLGKK